MLASTPWETGDTSPPVRVADFPPSFQTFRDMSKATGTEVSDNPKDHNPISSGVSTRQRENKSSLPTRLVETLPYKVSEQAGEARAHLHAALPPLS